MKQTYLYIATFVVSIVVNLADLHAQYDLGSDGSYGPLEITTDTVLQVPEDGIFHCTTITIKSGQELSFSKNAANTPVYLLATGDIVFETSADIIISGKDSIGVAAGEGGPGGFDGGQGGDQPGDGQGPGGGDWGWTSPSYGGKPDEQDYRGSAGFATRSTSSEQSQSAGEKYGNSLLIPIIGGSGGGGGQASTVNTSLGGGGGGGALVLASNTRILFSSNNEIRATGGNAASNEFGNGSGGSVRIVSPEISGPVEIRTYAGNSPLSYGGYGRIRIDTINRSSFSLLSGGHNSAQYATYGSNMLVFPTDFPQLRITQVGTDVIPEDNDAPVFVLFPAGSAETQTVSVKVTDFNTTVPLQAVVTPESGSRQTFDFEIDNSGGGSTTGSVQVSIPAGVSSRVDVWTR